MGSLDLWVTLNLLALDQLLRLEGWGPLEYRPHAPQMETLGKSLRAQGKRGGEERLSGAAVRLRETCGVTELLSEPLI